MDNRNSSRTKENGGGVDTIDKDEYHRNRRKATREARQELDTNYREFVENEHRHTQESDRCSNCMDFGLH